MVESKQRYKHQLESVTDYVYSVEVEDSHPVATTYGPGCAALTGYEVCDYETHPNLWHEIVHEEDRARVAEQTAKMFTEEKAVPLEYRIVHKNGIVRWVRNAPVLRYDRHGRLVGYDGLVEDITDRKRMEEMLRESEEKYRTLIEQSDDAIYLLYGGKFEVINRKFQEFFGITQEDVNNPDFVFTNIVAPKSRRLVKEWMSEGARHKLLPRYEFTALDRNGNEIEVELTVSYPTYKDGLATQGVLRDITERKKIEREREILLLKEREQRILAETLGEIFLALTAQISREAVLDEIFRQVQRVVSYSAANIVMLEADTLHVVRCYGYETFGGEKFLANLRQPVDAFPLDARAVRSRQPLVVPDTRQNPEWVTLEQTSWIRSSVAVPICLHEQVVGLLRIDGDTPNVFSAKDIVRLQPLANAAAIALENARLHDQARREIKERQQAEQELRQVTARNQAILDAMPDSLFYLNRQGELLDYRPVDENLWPGLLSEPESGHDLARILPPDLTDLILNYVEKTLNSGASQFFEHQIESPLGKQDFEVRLAPSGTNEVLVIVRNITDRKQAEQQAVRTERMAALGQLAASLAHEMNNPLQAIQSHLDLISDVPLETKQAEEYLQVISREIEHLGDISQRALNFAHLKPASPEPVAVVEQVQQVLSLASKQLEHSGIQVITDFQPVPKVWAAPDQINQVFLNLVINAAEATYDIGGQLHIAVYLDGDDVAISFSNDGPIISSEILPFIFEPFFTTKSGGSGLGLWVSHILVQQQSGSLTAENLGEHQGVTFTVKLPAVL